MQELGVVPSGLRTWPKYNTFLTAKEHFWERRFSLTFEFWSGSHADVGDVFWMLMRSSKYRWSKSSHIYIGGATTVCPWETGRPLGHYRYLGHGIIPIFGWGSNESLIISTIRIQWDFMEALDTILNWEELGSFACHLLSFTEFLSERSGVKELHVPNCMCFCRNWNAQKYICGWVVYYPEIHEKHLFLDVEEEGDRPNC